MTMPFERSRSVAQTHAFLTELWTQSGYRGFKSVVASEALHPR